MLEETKAPNLLIYCPLTTLGKSGQLKTTLGKSSQPETTLDKSGQPKINKLMARADLDWNEN